MTRARLFQWLSVLLPATLLVALLPLASATAVRETAFSALGFPDLVVEGSNQSRCSSVSFPFDAGALPPGARTVLSLHVSAFPRADQFELNFFLNGGAQPLATANEKDLRGGEWVRVPVPAAALLAEKNDLRVCAKTSYAVTKLVVGADSLVGGYLLPDFSAADAFTATPSEASPAVEDEFAVSVKARNSGAADAVVDYIYRRASLEEKQPEIVVLKGATEAQGVVVPKCQAFDAAGACAKPGEKEFVYWVKATQATKMTLLPAVLEFDNGFGEKATLESTRPTVEVTTPVVKIRPLILSEKEIVKAGQTYQGRVALKNEGQAGLKDVKVSLKVDPGLVLEGDDVKAFDFIPAEGTAYFDVRVRADEPGSYALGCEAVYLDKRLRFSECEPVTIVVEKEDFSPALLVGLGLVLVAAYAYHYINRS